MEYKGRMTTSIYILLLHSNPQALADLDSLNRKRYKTGLSRIPVEPEPTVTYEYQGEELEEVAREMEKAPSRSRD